MLKTEKTEGGVKFLVKAQPKASRAGITHVEEGALKVRLTAPPVKGAANEQCLKILAKALGVSKSSLLIRGGNRSRRKWIEVKGMDEASLKRIISQIIGQS